MTERWKMNRATILLLLTGAVFFFLKYLSPLVAPVFVAMLFVTIFGPLLQKLQSKLHIHRQIGAVGLLILAGAIVFFLLWILCSWLVGSLPTWIGRLELLENSLQDAIKDACGGIEKVLGIDSTYLQTRLLGSLKDGIHYVQEELVPGILSQTLTYAKALGKLGGFLVTFIITAIFLAKDYDEIMNNMLNREELHLVLEIICGITRYIATFVKAQLVIISLIAGICALVLEIGGIKQGILWGILAGILDALPFIGTGVVLIPMAIVQIFKGFYWKAVICIVLYIACIFIREFMEPRLIGRKVGVPAIAILLSLYVGISLFGIWGIIKGPLGFIIIYESYQNILRRMQINS